MNVIALSSLSVGMSMDAFAAALAKGATNNKPSFFYALKGGLFFGVVEAIAPMVGFLLAKIASDTVAEIDHWLAFILLMFLGGRFLWQAKYGDTDSDPSVPNDDWWMLIITAVATSVDSMVVGVSLAFLQVNIYLACLLIGLATTVMATIGLYLGHRLGRQMGKWAMVAGALVLMIIGVLILYSHLTAPAL